MKLPKRKKEKDPFVPPTKGLPSWEKVADMEIHFKTELACVHGIAEAILAQHIAYWCFANRANKKHFHDGSYWTYHTLEAFCWLFPFLKKNDIREALINLEKDNFIKTGVYNENKYDRTKWYSLSDQGLQYFLQNSHLSKSANRTKGKPTTNTI